MPLTSENFSYLTCGSDEMFFSSEELSYFSFASFSSSWLSSDEVINQVELAWEGDSSQDYSICKKNTCNAEYLSKEIEDSTGLLRRDSSIISHNRVRRKIKKDKLKARAQRRRTVKYEKYWMNLRPVPENCECH